MKPDPSFPEIDALLRSQQPQVSIPPQLEDDIHRALRGKLNHPTRKATWRWFLLPPSIAAAAIIAMMLNPSQPTGPEIGKPQMLQKTPDITVVPAPKDIPSVSLLETGNPLAMETVALSRDARRIGSWFMESLPSVSLHGE